MHLNKKKPCEAFYADIVRSTLLGELETAEGKKMATLACTIPAEHIVNKDAYISELQKKYEKLRVENASLVEKMNERLEPVPPTVGNEIAGTCEKCGLEGVEDMEAHIRECDKAAEFDSVYSYTKGTFGRMMYGNGAGDIYIVQTDFSARGAQYYKVGKTTNMQRRMVQYRTRAVCEPRLHCYFPFRDVERADRDIKKLLERFSVKREIYSGELDEIRSLIRGYQMRVDNCAAEFVPMLKCAPSIPKEDEDEDDVFTESLRGLKYVINANTFITY